MGETGEDPWLCCLTCNMLLLWYIYFLTTSSSSGGSTGVVLLKACWRASNFTFLAFADVIVSCLFLVGVCNLSTVHCGGIAVASDSAASTSHTWNNSEQVR